MGLHPTPVVIDVERAEFLYTPLFCEENIWHLARALVQRGAPADTLWVLLISNPTRQVAMLRQRAGDERGLALWDYHVILHARADGDDRIYDFDTTLPFPCDARRYFAESFPPEEVTPPPLRAMARAIPAAEYLHRFHSDRGHMVGRIPTEHFPPWPAITPTHPETTRLREYWDMEKRLDDRSRVEPIHDYRSRTRNEHP